MSTLNLSDFQLLKLIGHGYSGLVYHVREKISDKSFALKIIRKGQSNDSRILLEQDIQRSLSGSPYVLPLLASWHDSENFYLVSNICGGQDMDYNLSMCGPFNEDRARFYAAELLVALEDLKAHKILHRDIKPGNILFTTQGHIRLIDFGLATRVKASPVTQYTFNADPSACSGSFTIPDPDFTSAERVGTPSYMCPDQHLGRPYSFEGDLHSFGVTIYQMLTGRLPFGEGAQTREETLVAVCCEQLVFRSEDKVSPEARDLMSKLLGRDSKSPAQLEEIMNHSWFAGVCWDRVRAQMITPSWKPYFSALPNMNVSLEAYEGEPCSPDPYPGFNYISPEFLAMRTHKDGGLLNRLSKLFSRDQLPFSTVTPLSTLSLAASSRNQSSSAPATPLSALSASLRGQPPSSPAVTSSTFSSAPSASVPRSSAPPSVIASSAFSSAPSASESQTLAPPPVVSSSTFSPAPSAPVTRSLAPPPAASSSAFSPQLLVPRRVVSFSASSRAYARLCPPPTPPPDIPLPPLPTEVETSRVASSSPMNPEDDPSVARGALPPLHIRKQLLKRVPAPKRVRPIEGEMVLTPHVTITPAEDDAGEAPMDSTPALQAPLKDVTNQRYLSPSDAERMAFNPVLKPGHRVKLSAPPRRAKRAQKENASLQAPEPKPKPEPEPKVKVKVARTPPTAVFMLPPKSVPLPLVMPVSSHMQTPNKVVEKLKNVSQPPSMNKPKPVKSVSLTPVKPPSAPPQTPRKVASKDTSKPSPKTSPPKPVTPKVKPAFKVPVKVSESKLSTPPGSVRKRSNVAAKASTSPASTCSVDVTNVEDVYPRPLVRADTLVHPALAFADAKEKPVDYPRPPEGVSQPKVLKPLSIEEAFAPPPASPPGSKTTPKNVAPTTRFTSAPQACGVLNLSSEAFSKESLGGFYGLSNPRINLDPQDLKGRADEIFERARSSAIRDIRESPYLSARKAPPPIRVGPHYAGDLPGPSPTGIISGLRRLWIRLTMAVGRAVSWFRYRGEPGFSRI